MTAPETPRHRSADSVLDEHRSSPGLLLALLGQEAMRRLRAAHTAHNLKPRQFQILGLLHDHGGLAQRELGQTMGVDPSILVTLLNPLEADGLVARERDPADRRRHLVTLTPAGERQLAERRPRRSRPRTSCSPRSTTSSASNCAPCCSRCATGSPPTRKPPAPPRPRPGGEAHDDELRPSRAATTYTASSSKSCT